MDKTLILMLIEYVIRILVILIGGLAIDFIRKYKLEQWVKIGVNAAEQMYEADLIDMPKKEYVIKFVEDKFRFKINEDELDALIEAAVYELNTVKELKNKPIIINQTL